MSYKVIAGIDQSLNSTGVVVLDFQSGVLLYSGAIRLNKTVDTPSLFGAERLVYIRDRIFEILKLNSVDFVVIEGYSFGSSGQSIFDLGEVGGAVRILLHDMGIPFEVIPPKSLKKYIAENGNAKKPEMAAAVFQKYGMKFTYDDEVDAYALAQMAREIGPSQIESYLRMSASGKKKKSKN